MLKKLGSILFGIHVLILDSVLSFTNYILLLLDEKPFPHEVRACWPVLQQWFLVNTIGLLILFITFKWNS